MLFENYFFSLTLLMCFKFITQQIVSSKLSLSKLSSQPLRWWTFLGKEASTNKKLFFPSLSLPRSNPLPFSTQVGSRLHLVHLVRFSNWVGWGTWLGGTLLSSQPLPFWGGFSIGEHLPCWGGFSSGEHFELWTKTECYYNSMLSTMLYITFTLVHCTELNIFDYCTS